MHQQANSFVCSNSQTANNLLPRPPRIKQRGGECMEWNEFNGICSFCAACVAPRSVLRVLHLGKILPLGSWQSAPLVLDNEGLWSCEVLVHHGRRIKEVFVGAGLCLRPEGWSTTLACPDTMSGCRGRHKGCVSQKTSLWHFAGTRLEESPQDLCILTKALHIFDKAGEYLVRL